MNDIAGIGGLALLGTGLGMYDVRLALVGVGIAALCLSLIGALRWRD